MDERSHSESMTALHLLTLSLSLTAHTSLFTLTTAPMSANLHQSKTEFTLLLYAALINTAELVGAHLIKDGSIYASPA